MLHRAPSSGELSSGVGALASAQAQGGAALQAAAQSLGSTLFNSSEYAGLSTSNAQFVSDLYTGYLQRAPDDSGYAYWLNALNTGDTRAHQIAAFGVGEFETNVATLSIAYGSSDTIRYVLTDIQGSTRAMMNNNGSSSAVIARHDYLPFGEELGAGTGSRSASQGYGGGDTNRWKYGMLQRDAATGLDHTWWRKYESFSGRWTSPDPLRGHIANPQSFNGYNYTGNDPMNLVDPTGLDWYVEALPIEDEPIDDSPQNYESFLSRRRGDAWSGDRVDGGGDPSGGAGPVGAPQNPISQRPPKERVLIKQVPKQPITCEEHEWAVFNKEVKEVEAAAAKHFEEREKGPMSLGRVSRVMDRIDTILSFITGEGGEFDPGDGGDSWADLMNKQTRITEIDEGTQRATDRRDKRIEKNCKKP